MFAGITDSATVCSLTLYFHDGPALIDLWTILKRVRTKLFVISKNIFPSERVAKCLMIIY